MESGPVSSSFSTTSDGAILVSRRNDLPQAIRTAPQDATIEVPSEALMGLGQQAAGPDRLNRPDIKFRVSSPE